MSEQEILETDVLIIGTGVVGLRAALEAKRYDLDVLMVDKSLIARNSVSAFAGGSMSPSDTILMDDDERDRVEKALSWMPRTTPDRFASRCKGGWSLPYCMDQELIETASMEGADLQNEGVQFGVKYPQGTIWYHPPARGYVPFILPLLEFITEKGVRSRSHLFIIDLIKSGDSIVGALGLDLKTGNFVTIKSKATVLAAGGGAMCWERNNVPQVMTGDGAVMGYRAGVTLKNMEAVKFDAWIWSEPDLPMFWIFQCIPRRRGVVLNSEGEQFLQKYIPDDRMHNPTFNPDDIWDVRYGGRVIPYVAWIGRGMAMEVREGRGDKGAVLVDFSRNREEEWLESPHALANYNMMRDFDWKNNPVHVFPGAIGTDGGIKHDKDGITSVKGLYVGGDTGITHGIWNGLVFARRAGRSAAMYAREQEMPEIDMKVVNDKIKEVQEIENQPLTEEGDPDHVRKLIQKAMMKYVGPIRVGQELEKAIAELERIQKDLIPKLYARNPIQLRKALETKNMAIFGEVTARSALLREDTRAVHVRLDFPYMDNENWLKNTTVRLNSVTGKPEMGTEPIVKTWGPTPPPGKIPTKGLEKYWKKEE